MEHRTTAISVMQFNIVALPTVGAGVFVAGDAHPSQNNIRQVISVNFDFDGPGISPPDDAAYQGQKDATKLVRLPSSSTRHNSHGEVMKPFNVIGVNGHPSACVRTGVKDGDRLVVERSSSHPHQITLIRGHSVLAFPQITPGDLDVAVVGWRRCTFRSAISSSRVRCR